MTHTPFPNLAVPTYLLFPDTTPSWLLVIQVSDFLNGLELAAYLLISYYLNISFLIIVFYFTCNTVRRR